MFATHRFVKLFAVILVAAVCAAVAAVAGRTEPASVNEASYSVPVLMYHSVCKNDRVHSDYFILPEKFEEDIRYLKAHGYTAVFTEDIVKYVKGEKNLPEKSVVITLDDGFYNNLSNVLPVLKKYGFKDPAYAYLSWEDISVLASSGCVEIGSHTYDMHALGTRRGCKKKKGEDPVRYKELLTDDLTKLQNALKEKSGVEAKVFAYPYGEFCDESQEVLEQLGFIAAYNCREKVNVINSQTDLYSLCRINRPGHMSTEEFMKKWEID